MKTATLLHFMGWIPLAVLLTATMPSVSTPRVPSDPLFADTSLLHITLRGSLAPLLSDRSKESTYYPLQLKYEGATGTIALGIRAKVRGHFRKQEGVCTHPPLLLNFNKASTKATLFEGQEKVKLVMPCRDAKYVVREYLVYKLYAALTLQSFRPRLVMVHLEDTVKTKATTPFYGILLEEEWQVAQRIGGTPLENQIVRPESLDREAFLRAAVFEYLIGNTDWSVQYQQNIKLVKFEGGAPTVPVPYDFDHSGIVSAPYAQPLADLQLASVRERRYRGYCLDLSQFAQTFAFYNERREALNAVYRGNPLLEEKYIATTLRYLNAFYETINDPRKAKQAFGYPCEEGNTNNIIIRPLEN